MFSSAVGHVGLVMVWRHLSWQQAAIVVSPAGVQRSSILVSARVHGVVGDLAALTVDPPELSGAV